MGVLGSKGYCGVIIPCSFTSCSEISRDFMLLPTTFSSSSSSRILLKTMRTTMVYNNARRLAGTAPAPLLGNHHDTAASGGGEDAHAVEKNKSRLAYSVSNRLPSCRTPMKYFAGGLKNIRRQQTVKQPLQYRKI